MSDVDFTGQGRFGGVLLLIGGAVLLLLGLVMGGTYGAVNDDAAGPPAVARARTPRSALHLGLLLGGPLLMVVGGLSYRASRPRPPPKISKAEARAQLEVRPLPFWFCARCRVFMDRNLTGDCLECFKKAGCIEVGTEAERGTALAVLGS